MPNSTASGRCPFTQIERVTAIAAEGHQDEDAGGVRPALRVDIGAEDDRDREGDQREDKGQRTRGLRPLRGHPVARQVARHQIEQPGHRRGPGEPEDQDRADVVDRPEASAEILVRQVGEGAPVCLAARLEGLLGDQQGSW